MRACTFETATWHATEVSFSSVSHEDSRHVRKLQPARHAIIDIESTFHHLLEYLEEFTFTHSGSRNCRF
jgi:hypothetical protein